MAREKKLHSKKKNERYFMIRLYIVMTLIMLITLYPMWYSVINSLNSAADLSKNGYAYLLPRDFTLDSWKAVVKDGEIVRAFGITASRTILVTFFQTLITAMFAYGFSRNNLIGKKFYTLLGFTSMYLSGGVIAYFILFNYLKLYNSYWVDFIMLLFLLQTLKEFQIPFLSQQELTDHLNIVYSLRLFCHFQNQYLAHLEFSLQWVSGMIIQPHCIIHDHQSSRHYHIICFLLRSRVRQQKNSRSQWM